METEREQTQREETLTTGELAGRAGVNLQTVRYYERRGLLPEPPRTAVGYRQFDGEDVRAMMANMSMMDMMQNGGGNGSMSMNGENRSNDENQSGGNS